MSSMAIEAIEAPSTRPAWPSFSIVMPTYQRREVVCDAVRALSEIDYPGDRELIVVVDGSTDGTANGLRQIDCPFPLKIIELPSPAVVQEIHLVWSIVAARDPAHRWLRELILAELQDPDATESRPCSAEPRSAAPREPTAGGRRRCS